MLGIFILIIIIAGVITAIYGLMKKHISRQMNITLILKPKQVQRGKKLRIHLTVRPRTDTKVEYISGALFCKRYDEFKDSWLDKSDLPIISRGAILLRVDFSFGESLELKGEEDNEFKGSIDLPEEGMATEIRGIMQVHWFVVARVKVKNLPVAEALEELVVLPKAIQEDDKYAMGGSYDEAYDLFSALDKSLLLDIQDEQTVEFFKGGEKKLKSRKEKLEGRTHGEIPTEEIKQEKQENAVEGEFMASENTAPEYPNQVGEESADTPPPGQTEQFRQEEKNSPDMADRINEEDLPDMALMYKKILAEKDDTLGIPAKPPIPLKRKAEITEKKTPAEPEPAIQSNKFKTRYKTPFNPAFKQAETLPDDENVSRPSPEPAPEEEKPAPSGPAFHRPASDTPAVAFKPLRVSNSTQTSAGRHDVIGQRDVAGAGMKRRFSGNLPGVEFKKVTPFKPEKK